VRLLLLVALVGCADQEQPGTVHPATRTELWVPPEPEPEPEPEPVQQPDAGADFTPEAKLLFRVAACGNDDPLPPHLDATVVAHHCALIRARMATYRDTYVVGGRAFFDALVPDDIPPAVVYPFGGGDLISALVAFPDATEITTISLELAGDPRRITTIDAARLEKSLAAMRVEIGGTLEVGSNTSENLSASQSNDLPAQVSSFLMGLAATGHEPVGMRYFRLEPDGAVHYLEPDEIAAIEARAKKAARAKKRKSDWTSPNFSEAFAHVEIRYRKLDDAPGVVRVHRHLGWNLADPILTAEPELLRHLEAKGKVAMMTKGASYLLWLQGFRRIRDYMLANLAWMISDSTGIPPAFAGPAGMVQETYGTYRDAWLEHSRGTRHSRDFARLWRDRPRRPLPFRFGYLDSGKSPHLVVTRPQR
jgi:hypothetical protein